MKRLFAICTIPFFAAAATLFGAAEEEKKSFNLADVMSAEAFDRAGLDKLSPEELDALERWLDTYVYEEKQRAAKVAVEERKEVVRKETEKAFGFLDIWSRDDNVPEELVGPEYIESAIRGEFTGWKGETTFELENGQVWQQTGGDRYFLPLENPNVRIEKGLLGAHYLRIVETGRRVKVKRIR